MIEIVTLVTAIGIKIQAVFVNVDDMEYYRWTNQVLVDEKPPEDCNGNRPTVPYFDPPSCGWSYSKADTDKYYWDSENMGRFRYTEAYNRSGNVYTFEDSPYGVVGDYVLFNTCLVDIRNDEEIYCKRWKLTKNGVTDENI